MTQRRVRLVVNPSARAGRGRRDLACFLTHLGPGVVTETVTSTSAENFRDLVKTAASTGDTVAVAGGDGTVALALNAGPGDTPLAIVPTGSGNDLARNLGITSLAEAARAVTEGQPIPVDVGLARWPGHERRFTCVGSAGLDALALAIVHRSGWPRSMLLNLAAMLWALVRYRPVKLRIRWQDGGHFEGDVAIVCVTNTRSYGGGFLVSPDASLFDGRLDLCIVRPMNRLRLLAHFPRILRGTHGRLREVIQAQSVWVRLEGIGGETPVALDGELPEATTPIEFRCEPGAVHILMPPASRKAAPRG